MKLKELVRQGTKGVSETMAMAVVPGAVYCGPAHSVPVGKMTACPWDVRHKPVHMLLCMVRAQP